MTATGPGALPPRFAEVAESLRLAAANPEGIAEQVDRLQALQQELLAITSEPHEGHSASSRCSVALDGAGTVHAVSFDGSLTLRPTVATISQEFLEAFESARAVAFDSVRAKYREQFGIELPEFDAGAQAATQDAADQVTTSLVPAVGDAFFGSQIAGILAQAQQFAQREFQGSDGCVTLTMKVDKQPISVEIDSLLLRQMDNVTLGEQFLRAWQQASTAIEAARAGLGRLELGDLDPQVARARAQQSLDLARRKIAEAGF